MEEDEENIPESPRAHDDDLDDDDESDDKEGKHNEEDNQTYHTPTKTGSPTTKKRKISSI